jgi:hypothetical protein
MQYFRQRRLHALTHAGGEDDDVHMTVFSYVS